MIPAPGPDVNVFAYSSRTRWRSWTHACKEVQLDLQVLVVFLVSDVVA